MAGARAGGSAASVLLLASCAVGLQACSDATGPEDCSGEVEVTAGAGVSPAFDWIPACRLSALLVEDAGDGTDRWIIETPGENGIVPPVTYGVVPDGVVEIDDPDVLVAGRSYRVVLFGRTESDGDSDVLLGFATFAP